MIRIVVSDPSPRVRAALRMRLDVEPDMQVVATSASVAEACDAAVDAQAHVAVVDVTTDGAPPPAGVTGPLHELARRCAVVVLALSDVDRGAAPAGAPFVSKYSPEADLVDAVRRAHATRPTPDIADGPPRPRGGDRTTAPPEV